MRGGVKADVLIANNLNDEQSQQSAGRANRPSSVSSILSAVLALTCRREMANLKLLKDKKGEGRASSQ